MSKIALGKSGKHTVSIDLDILLRTRALVEGNSGCGKSETLQYLAEQFDGKVQVIFIDLEGEFAILRKKHNYVLVGKGGDTPADCRSAAMLAHRLLELRASAVCDLYEMKASDRHRWVRLFLESLIDAPKNLWHPVIIIIDEIHAFCPEKGAGESEASDAVISLATRGRKRGFCLIGATQRLGKLRKDVAAELLNILVGMTFIDIDRKRAAEALGIPRSDQRKFFDEIKVMEEGQFWVLGKAISKDRILVHVNRVETPRAEMGSAKHSAEPPPPPERVKALLPKLADLPKAAEEKTKTEADLRQEVRSLKMQIIQYQQAAQKQMNKEWKAPAKETVKKVEVHVIKPAELLRVERLLSKMDLAAGRFQELFGSIRSFSDAIRDNVSKIEKAQRGLLIAPTPPRSVFSRVPIPTKAVVVPEVIFVKGRIPARAGIASEQKPDGEVTPKQRKILVALSEFEAIGRESVPRTWIAARSGSSPRSSSYANNLSALRSRGLIDYDGVGIRLTDDGRRAAPTTDSPLDAAGMKESCLKLLSPKQRQIFEALHHIYPEIAAREDIAGEIRCSPNSSSFANNLSALRSAGMIESGRRDGTERLSDWVMVEMNKQEA